MFWHHDDDEDDDYYYYDDTADDDYYYDAAADDDDHSDSVFWNGLKPSIESFCDGFVRFIGFDSIGFTASVMVYQFVSIVFPICNDMISSEWSG